MRKYRLNVLKLINGSDVVEAVNLTDALARHPLCTCKSTQCDSTGQYVQYYLEFRATETQIKEVIVMSPLLSEPSIWEVLL